MMKRTLPFQFLSWFDLSVVESLSLQWMQVFLHGLQVPSPGDDKKANNLTTCTSSPKFENYDTIEI